MSNSPNSRRPSRRRADRPHEPPPETQGRERQRRRTRKAIVDAAVAMLARGETPTVAAVADAADVSRRTVYMYFPTLDQLLLDATAGVLGQQVLDRQLAEPATPQDVEARVERLARSVQGMSPEVERLGRALIRLTVEAGGAADRRPGPLRGFRRMEWIEQALAPVRRQLGPKRFARLAAALAMVIGWEALVVQRDLAGLSPADGADLSAWAAIALLRAALDEAGAGLPGRSG
jgi:AcrR family transcriptional regulator